MWIVAFLGMGTYLNFTYKSCFSQKLCHKPWVEFVLHSIIPFTISICTILHYLVWQLIAEIMCTSSNVWALAFSALWFHTLVTVLGHTTDWLLHWALSDVRILPKPHWTILWHKNNISIASADDCLCLKSFHSKTKELILSTILFSLKWLHVPALTVNIGHGPMHRFYVMQILSGFEP